MNKVTASLFTSVTTIIGIVVFFVLVGLIATRSSWPFTTHETHLYGPYACENMDLVLRVEKTHNRMKGEKTQTVDLLKNGEKISLNNYNPEGITYMRGLHWERKCEPIVTSESAENIDTIANCLDNVIESGKLKEVSLCGIARFDTTMLP